VWCFSSFAFRTDRSKNRLENACHDFVRAILSAAHSFV
jgi:hypothetical protein